MAPSFKLPLGDAFVALSAQKSTDLENGELRAAIYSDVVESLEALVRQLS